MEYWNIGFFRNKLSFVISLFSIFPHIIPSFHYSNVPPSLFLFFTPLKYSFDLPSPLNQAGQEGNLPLYKEHHAGDEVCEEISASEFIIDQHRRLMDSSAPPDALDKCLME